MRRTSSLVLPLVVLCLALPLSSGAAGAAGDSTAARWRNLGPDGGILYALVTDPTDPQIVYTGGIGGVFKSSDGGATWTVANRGLRPPLPQGFNAQTLTVTALVLDRNHPSRLYAGLLSGGVAKSTDGGASWTHLDGGLGNPWVNGLALDPTNGDRLFAATLKGLYRTADGGASWRLLTRGLPPPSTVFVTVALAPSAPRTMFAAAGDANGHATILYRSDDGSATWHAVSAGGLIGQLVIALAIDPHDPRIVFAGTLADVFRSLDGGTTWQATRLGGPAAYGLAIHPTRPGIVYAATDRGIYRTTDSGARWAPLNRGIENRRFRAVAFSPDTPRTLYAASDFALNAAGTGGVFKSRNAATSWQFSGHGIAALGTRAFAIDPKTPSTLWLSTLGGLWKSRDRGESWSSVSFRAACPGFGPDSIAIDPGDPQTVYITTNYFGGHLCRTHDGGASWAALYDSSGSIIQLRIDPKDSATLYATGTAVLKSVDRGTTWKPLGGTTTPFAVFDLQISPADSATVFAAGIPPRPSASLIFDILRTTDAGANWVDLPDLSDSGFLGSFALSPLYPATLYATADGNVLKSVDGGAHWSTVSDAFSHSSARIDLLPADPAALYLSVSGDNIYRSTDQGVTWAPVADRPDHLLFLFLIGDPQDAHRLYAGTNGGALLALTTAE
jgi:photosystem II stability/assembly factor-like uncharacterized protein